MAGLLIMAPIALGLALFFLWYFFWSVKNGDIIDSEMNNVRFLLDTEDDVDNDMKQEKTK